MTSPDGLKRECRSGARARKVPARGGIFVALAFALSGCVEAGDGGFDFLTAANSAQGVSRSATGQTTTKPKRVQALKAVPMAGGKVVIAGPRGYCVDRASLRPGFAGGFALIASCNSLNRNYASADAEPVVMTVQVQPSFSKQEAPTANDLSAAVAPVRTLAKLDGDGVSLVQLASGGDRGIPAGDPRHWRGAMMINGYLVGIALYAPKGNALAGRRGKKMMIALAESLRRASPVKDYAPQAKARAAAKKTQ
jgi:hypothetical protein